MGKLPSIRRILREDLKDAPNWIDGLIYPINIFFESIYRTLNKNVTFNDNIACFIKEITVRTTAGYSSGVAGGLDVIQFPSELVGKAQGLLVISCIDITTSAYNTMLNPVYCDWLDINRTININYVAGLKASSKYNIRLLII